MWTTRGSPQPRTSGERCAGADRSTQYAPTVPEQILVVEDDTALAEMLGLALRDAGYEPRLAHDGERGLAAAIADEPALVILDVGLPRLDGFEVCRRLRAAGCVAPIILLTSRSDEIDKVLGLELGADDYMTKPFSVRELVARIRSAMRRVAMTPTAQVWSSGRLHLDRARWLARYADVELSLTTTEFDLLWTLANAGGNVCDRDTLITALYGPGVVVADRTIDTFVKRIRRKIGEVDDAFDALQTVRGVGYRYRA